MKKLAIIALAAGTAFAAAPAYKAATNIGWYVGLGLNNYAVTSQTGTGLARNINLNGFVGYRNTKHFGNEFGLFYDGKPGHLVNQMYFGITPTNHWVSYYDGMFYMPVYNGFEVFGKVGLNLAHVANATITSYAFGMNYGVGAQYMYKQFGVRFVYTDNHYTRHFMPSVAIPGTEPNTIGLDLFYSFA